jgi:hypothetical protein
MVTLIEFMRKAQFIMIHLCADDMISAIAI